MLRPEVHHTFLKHKKTDSLYALNYSYVLSDNVPFIFPLGDSTSLIFLYMWNACSYITAFQQKNPYKQKPTKQTKSHLKNHKKAHKKPTDTHIDMRK